MPTVFFDFGFITKLCRSSLPLEILLLHTCKVLVPPQVLSIWKVRVPQIRAGRGTGLMVSSWPWVHFVIPN